MQLLVVEAFPDFDFYVYHNQRENLMHLERRKNVHINEPCGSFDAYVNVIGTGFLYKGKRAIVSKLMAIPFEKKVPKEKNAIVDCSITIPKGRTEAALMRREMRKYGYISTRDDTSLDYISHRARGSEVKKYEDIVFSATDYIAPRCSENLLGVVAANRLYSAENYEYCRTLAAVCDRYIEKYKGEVLLFAFDTGFENDTAAAVTIKHMMKRPNMAEIVPYESSPEEIFEAYARCEKIISTRFHGVIAALMEGVKTVAVSDTLKLSLLSKKYGFAALKKSGLTEAALWEALENAAECELPQEVSLEARGHIDGLKNFLMRQM